MAHRPLHRLQIQGNARMATRGAQTHQHSPAAHPQDQDLEGRPERLGHRCLRAQELVDERVRGTSADHEAEVGEKAEQDPAEPGQQGRAPPSEGRLERFRPARGQDREGRHDRSEFLPAGEHPRDPYGGQPDGAASHALDGPEHERTHELELAKVVPDQRPEERGQRHEQHGRQRHTSRIAIPTAPGHKPRG